MKETTKLILAAVGSGVVANMLLGDRVAAATSDYKMPAAGAEGIVALGGAYGAWKWKGRKRMIAAVAAGVGAGLLVSSVQGGLMAPPPAAVKPSATPQSLPQGKSAGAALPSANPVPIPLQGVVGPGGSMSGTIPQGSIVPTPNRPPTQAETQAYADYLAQELQNQQIAAAQQAAALQGGSLPVVSPTANQDTDFLPSLGSLFDGGQSGAAFRVGMAKRGGFGGAGASFRRRY